MYARRGLESLSRRRIWRSSNAVQRGTHIRRHNRKRFDGAVAVVRSVAASRVALCFMTGGRGGYFAKRSLRMTEAVLKPQCGAKAERRQLQRTCGTAAVRAPDAGVIGWTEGRGDGPDPLHSGRNAPSTR